MTCEWCRESIAFLDASLPAAAQIGTRNAPLDGCRSRPALPEEPGPKPERSEVTEDMATASQRTPREVVDFPPNAPVTVALKYSLGKTVSGQYGERIMYSLTDGRVMFLDLAVAAQIEELGINVRESFTITRCPTGQKGAFMTWEIARVAGEQPNAVTTSEVFDLKPTSNRPRDSVKSWAWRISPNC